MKTYAPKKAEIVHEWYHVDAAGQNLGRLASDIARVLRGKHKPMYSLENDVGDYVVVTNAERIVFTGKKASDKIYYSHSNYPGGLTEITLEKMMGKHPERVLIKAIRGMLPHNRLGEAMFRKLKVYAGPKHPHEAQQLRDLGQAFIGQKTGATYEPASEG